MDIYTSTYISQSITRINKLDLNTQAKWGKMSVDQMLAHLNVAYDMSFTDKYTQPNAVMRFFIKLLAKKQIVGLKPYPKNGRTAPQFVISEARNFESEKQKLIDYIEKVVALGRAHFEGFESHSFGKLTVDEWNILFEKHMEHHLTQFGV